MFGEEMRRHFSHHVNYLFRSLITPDVPRLIFEISQMSGTAGREGGRGGGVLTGAMTHTQAFTFPLW